MVTLPACRLFGCSIILSKLGQLLATKWNFQNKTGRAFPHESHISAKFPILKLSDFIQGTSGINCFCDRKPPTILD